MGLLDTLGEALDRPWSASGATPEQISTNPWARRGLVLSALGNNMIPAWEQGHRNFGTTIAAHGELARRQSWEDQQRAYAMQQAQAQTAQAAQLDQMFTQAQQGAQNGPQGALADPSLGPPGPTVQRAAGASTAPQQTAQQYKAEQYRKAAYMVSARNPEMAQKYMELADKLDPREEFFAPTETAGGLVQFSKAGGQRATGQQGKPAELPPDIRALEHVTGKPMAGTGAAGLAALKDYRKSGASTQSVTVGGEKALINSVATGLGKQLDDSRAVALTAIPSIETAQTLRRAVDSGKIVAGPGATFRVLGLQLGQLLGVGGKDSAETLLNTRGAIQSMAKAELDAAQMMKGQGQITEAERDIIRRAAAGNIDGMTAPELTLLSNVMEKTARYKLSAHKRNVESLKSIEGSAPLLPLYEVPEPPAYEAPARVPKVRRYDPKTGKFE